MRILFLADPFLPVPPRLYGGMERILASVMEGAQSAGHEVALLAHPESHLEGVRLYPLRGGEKPGCWDVLRNKAQVQRAMREFRPDLLHSFARLLYLMPFLARAIPKIMAYHREPTGRTVRWAARLGRNLIFTGCSESLTERGRKLGGRWKALPNGIELKRYRFQDHVPEDAPLVFLSRMDRIKGAHQAIAAARETGRRLILAGNRRTDGAEAEYWQKEIAPHLGQDGISYVGPVDDAAKSELLGRARALLVPIEWEEPFGMVFVEALACGTPVISLRRGALPEIIEDGRQGFLCEQAAELPEAIRRVGAISRAECRARAEARFSSELMCRRYEELYRRMAPGGREERISLLGEKKRA